MAIKPNAPKGKKIDVAGMLHAATTEGYVGSAEEIYEPGKDTTVADEFKQTVFLGDPDEGQKPLPQPDNSTRADLATKAIQDDEGNSIKETYATNENLGITKYPHFSITNKYSKGTTVYLDDDRKLYQFIVDHEPGAWDISQVTPIDHISAHILQELGEDESSTISQRVISGYIKDIFDQLAPLNDGVHVIDSAQYLIAFADVNNTLLGGIKKNGEWYIPKGLPEETKKALDDIYSNLRVETSEQYILIIKDANNHFLMGFRKDGSLDCPIGITKEADERLKKIENKFMVIENETYLMAFLDNNKKFLGGILRSGKWHIPNGVPDESLKYFNLIKQAIQRMDSTLNNEINTRTELITTGQGSWCWVITDQNQNIWLAGDKEGNVIIPHGIPEDLKPVIQKVDLLCSHIKIKEISGILGAFIDSNQNILWRVLRNGDFEIANALKSLTGFSIKVKDTDAKTLYHIVDKNGRLLFNIKDDGTLVGGNGIILDNLKSGIKYVDSDQWLFAITDTNGKILGGIDRYGALFANSIRGVMKADVIESDNWLFAFKDNNGNILFGIDRQGRFFANSVIIDGVPTTEVSNTFLYVILDSNRRVLFGIMRSGYVYIPRGVPEEVKLIIDKITHRIDELETSFSPDNIKTKVDWSNSSYISIPEPRCAVINITGTNFMPTSKTQNLHAYLEFWDMQGNYFKKKAILNAQGNSSMVFIKKNAAFDIVDDDWVGDDTPSIRFGKWVPQDSFHMKAYYTDFFRGVGPCSYKLYEQMVTTRGNKYDRPWKEMMIPVQNIKATTNSFNNPLQDNLELQFDTGARCFPDGFPVICYLNGIFYGVFSWQLKKHRDNMHQDKNSPENIHLDGTLGTGQIWNGNVDWTAFEVRNPKKLYCINTEAVSGYAYESLSDSTEIANIGNNYQEVVDKPSDFTNDYIISTYGNNPPTYLYRKSKDKWYKLVKLEGYRYLPYDGDHPVELIDSSMQYYDVNNKDHVRTDKVKRYILNLSKTMSILKAAAATYEASSKTTEDLKALKEVIETYFSKTNLIDYVIVSDIIKNSDGFNKNWQWFTYNGVKWFVGLYDCDMSFGGHFQGNQITNVLTGHLNGSTSIPTGYVIKYYWDDMKARYKELADLGIISKDNIFGIIKDWTDRIGEVNYEKEYKRWSDSPCIGESRVRENYWSLMKDEDGNPITGSSETFNATNAYAVGDEVYFGLNSLQGYYKFKCIQATEALETNQAHTVSKYSPISYFRHTDNIYRVETWIETNINNMDKLYGYTRK